MLAYLSLDEMLQGTGSLRVSASPLLHKALREAAKTVAWPVGEAISVRDGWRLQEPINSADVHFGSLASGSSYVSFAAQHGVPSAHFVVLGKEWRSTYALRHQRHCGSYRTPGSRVQVDLYVSLFSFPPRVWGVTTLVLSESRLPPVDFREVSGSLYNGWQMFVHAHSSALASSGYDFTGVLDAIEKEIEIMESTMTYLTKWYDDAPISGDDKRDGDKGGGGKGGGGKGGGGKDSCSAGPSLREYRQIEERLQRVMAVKRGLLGPRGVGRTFTTHLMVGPDPEDPLEPSQYPHAARAITLALAQKTPWESVHQELSYILAALTAFRELFASDAVPDTFPII
ncbi:LOW QUALITY PROTEIN: uncharacterized protein LOC119579235 [Penaeus monodon]|uniref:LOW QUALITY PROTEIN: uncharacterized protein LOC119579235 n=1 Tax=Penaeus monodon TaxID=6687 RepID=UPI0018A782A8|nr:LOW QUALITY PROTEIN: uncharacterized protein LOC119579235 [Penaeus monodon]